MFLSTYSLEIEYFLKLITKPNVPITISKHWSKDYGDKYGRTLIEFKGSPICFCHPKLEHFGSMHTKLWLLEFEGFLRVVVTSGNMTSADWLMYIQTVWVQDFPISTTNSSNEFQTVLFEHWGLLTCGLPTNWLSKYDFSNAKVDLVPSIPGYHKEKMNQYGHMRIRSLLKKYNVKKSQGNVIFQFSSFGKLTQNWVKEFCKSVGCDESELKLVFPTHDRVLKSRYGMNGAGMSFLDQKNYESKGFPQKSMCDFVPITDDYLLAHSKILFHFEVKNSDLFSWVLIGSHNFSGAAMGRLQKNETQLQIYNYELGVFFPPKTWSNLKEIKNETAPYPIPFSLDLKRYQIKDKPWYIKNLEDSE